MEFLAKVEATVIVTKDGSIYAQIHPKYTLHCKTSFDDDMASLEITEVSFYQKLDFDGNKFLTQYLTPYLYSEELDEVARAFLEEFYPEALEKPCPVSVSAVIQGMGLTVKYVRLSPQIFGQTYFDHAEVEVEKENGEPATMAVAPGTILVNKGVGFMGIGKENNTIIHECIHQHRHKNFFRLQKLLHWDIQTPECEVDAKYAVPYQGVNTQLRWMEWQANVLTPRILMPKEMFRQKYEELYETCKHDHPYLPSVGLENTAKKLAEFFEVSVQSAKIRMLDIGCREAIGIWNFVGEEQVPSFSFSEEYWNTYNKYETYIYNPERITEDISGYLAKGYILVDQHLCLDDDKYIYTTSDGTKHMRKNARNNIDKCCIKFTLKPKRSTDDKKDTGDYYYQCFLCRQSAKDYHLSSESFDKMYNLNPIQLKTDLERKINQLQERHLSFHQQLDSYMQQFKDNNGKPLSNATWERITGISTNSLDKFRSGAELPSVETLAALCLSMHLPPLCSVDLFDKCGKLIDLRYRPAILAILEVGYPYSLQACNNALKEKANITIRSASQERIEFFVDFENKKLIPVPSEEKKKHNASKFPYV